MNINPWYDQIGKRKEMKIAFATISFGARGSSEAGTESRIFNGYETFSGFFKQCVIILDMCDSEKSVENV